MLIIGCDLHTRYQQIAMLDTGTGELVERHVEHENGEASAFYQSLPPGARVGIEATVQGQWHERLIEGCGHELWVGDAAQIRATGVRQQKTDVRDAVDLMELLRTNRFPRIWVPPPHSQLRFYAVGSQARDPQTPRAWSACSRQAQSSRRGYGRKEEARTAMAAVRVFCSVGIARYFPAGM
jgi:transposase